MNKPTLEQILKNTKELCNYKVMGKLYPEFYKYIIGNFKGDKFSEKLYNYFYPNNNHKCPICGNNTKFIDFKNGYHKYCCIQCQGKSTDVKNHRKNTFLRKYGVSHNSQIEYIRDKKIKYNIFTTEEFKNKSKQTCLQKYGVEYISQTDFFKNKVKQTCLQKYGVSSPFQCEKIKEKIKYTCIEKYDGIGLASPVIKEKIKQTNLERYGVESVFQNKYIQNKALLTQKRKFILKTPNLIGYTKNGNWICKCPHPNTCNKCKEKFYITKSGLYNDRIKLNNELCTKLFPVGSKEFGVSNASKVYFNQLKEYFSDLITEYPLGKYKLDCYIPSLKVDIEYNGVYWHANPALYNSSDILNFYGIYKIAQEIWNHDKKRKEYIERQGIKVITIWDNNLPEPEILAKQILDNSYINKN